MNILQIRIDSRKYFLLSFVTIMSVFFVFSCGGGGNKNRLDKLAYNLLQQIPAERSLTLAVVSFAEKELELKITTARSIINLQMSL